MIPGRLRPLVVALLAFLPGATAAEVRWWKGNLHTHSFWSDGDDFPDSIAAWYKDQGYHFLALSDHNRMLEGERWIVRGDTPAFRAALATNAARFGPDWLQHRTLQGTNQVRLKTLAEFRDRLEVPGRFLLIPAEEVTSGYLSFPVHLNATNLREPLEPSGGTNVLDVMQRGVNSVLDQRRRTGQPMMPHINHPNFGWGITAEDLMALQGELFFEVYNGHPSVRNEGDDVHAGLDRVWDILLAWRLGRLGLPVMYGLATDDSHHYHSHQVGQSNPGRAWVMVRAERLEPAALIAALEAGNFYASSGVTLRDVRRTSQALHIEIEPEKGITYSTRFIGTRRGFDPTRSPVMSPAGEPVRATWRYDDSIGETLAVVVGVSPSYEFAGDELYVRALVTSSKRIANPYREGETASAWVQP
ncbi:MAG: hypothetical protein J0L84_02825 [Verrucomicrobia bacterium]|nr:hypothetical protein [Verrucomicrobiota bacterium]